MNIRFFIAANVGLIFFQLTEAWGFLPPGRSPLPNFDKRQVASVTARPDAGAQQAEAALKARIPELRVSRDAILGTPRLVSTSHGFLTGPGGSGIGFASAIDPHAPIKNFLNEHAALFGHNADVLAAATVKRDYTTAHNGLHTVIWEQTLDAIAVFDGLLVGHITRNGHLVSVSSRFVPDAPRAANAGTPNRATLIASPTVTAARAVVNAASNIGVEQDPDALAALGEVEGPQKR